MPSNKCESNLKNRKPRDKAKDSSVEAEDDKKAKIRKNIDTKDIRNLPISLQRGKSNHKWLAMMTVLGALLLKLLNEYNNKKKNKDTFYTTNVNAFLEYSTNSSFLTHLDEQHAEYPFEHQPENITLVGSEYIKYDVENAFIYSWREYSFNNTSKDKIDFVAEALDTKLLMLNNTQSENHRAQLKYVIQQDLAILRYAQEFGMSPSALGGLLSSYNLLENEKLLKKSFPNGANILTKQILAIQNTMHGTDFQESELNSLDIQFLKRHLVAVMSDNSFNLDKIQGEFAKNKSSIEDLYLASKEHHYDSEAVNITEYWHSIHGIKLNNTKTIDSPFQMKMKSKKKTNSLNKLRYVDTNTKNAEVDVSYCKLPSSLLTALTKGRDENEISKTKKLFDDVPDMKENYVYAMELVRSCYHIFMESKVSANYGGVPAKVMFSGATFGESGSEGLIESKHGSFYFKPSTLNVLKNDDILESIYYAFYASKSKTFHLWIFEIFQHYAQQLDKFHYDKLWFSHTLKYLYLSFLNDNEGIDHKRVVLTEKGHIYPIDI